MWSDVKRDYTNAKKAWTSVQHYGNVEPNERKLILDFYNHIDTNIENLQQDTQNFNAMPQKEKDMIKLYRNLQQEIRDDRGQYGL